MSFGEINQFSFKTKSFRQNRLISHYDPERSQEELCPFEIHFCKFFILICLIKRNQLMKCHIFLNRTYLNSLFEIFTFDSVSNFGACVIGEPWFNCSRDLGEL